MRPGNLSYHFPSKRELLRAVIAKLVGEYSERLQAFVSEPDIPLGQELESLVDWLLTDAVTPQTVRIFRELWAMSLHDAVIRRAVDDFYDEVIDGVVQVLRRARPSADITAIRELVHMLAIMSEGSCVLYGMRKERAVPHRRIIELVPALLRAVAPDLQIDVAGASKDSRATSSGEH
jgi:AcrR family transcriptional regulator